MPERMHSVPQETVPNLDGMDEWSSLVMGLLRAPSVRIINRKKMGSVKVFRLEFLTDILHCVSSIVHCFNMPLKKYF